MSDPQALILASGSAARRALLSSAGLFFRVCPADVDEAAIKAQMTTPKKTPITAGAEDIGAGAATIAAALAVAKAQAVSRQHPGAFVIGADQVLSFGGELLFKASSAAEARFVLKRLRGHSHVLISAAALARDGEVVWQAHQRAVLTMRKFSDAFLEQYLDQADKSVLACVGCYELEGLGVQLFEKIDGDYFTILGLPLVPLLGALREHGVVMT
ncbi:MAG: Maf family protein [Hyphomicrobium sp.]